jgi:hypothetical protein
VTAAELKERLAMLDEFAQELLGDLGGLVMFNISVHEPRPGAAEAFAGAGAREEQHDASRWLAIGGYDERLQVRCFLPPEPPSTATLVEPPEPVDPTEAF